MPPKLPPADLGFLPRSPLELVVAQVRHDDRPIEAATALAVQERLGGGEGLFPRIEQVELHTASVAITPGSVSPGPPEVAQGWHLKSGDGEWTAALLPGHFSLETTKYTTWDEFKQRLENVIAAVDGSAAPVMEQRLGLRYVDRLTRLGVDEPQGWSKWIDAAILGPVLHEALGAAVRSTRQQVDLDFGDRHLCVLRHGTVTDDKAAPGEELNYLLDFDIYRQESRRFSAGEVLHAFQSFHEKADALFREVITSELFDYLSGGQNG